MSRLNYKHLRYFWAVAKAGSIVRASERLHLAPHSISGQLREFERSLGAPLFYREGRRQTLTDTGRRVLGYAENIFSLGDELLEAVQHPLAVQSPPFAVGVADSVPKVMAYRLVEPVSRLDPAVRLICREGPLDNLLADLALHKLDLVIADRPMPSGLNVRGYSHLLGSSGVAICGSDELARRYGSRFPAELDSAPFLMPGDGAALRAELDIWLERHGMHPRIVGEFDDGALLKAFGRAGAGLFPVAAAVVETVVEHYGVRVLGFIDEVQERLYAISTERRLTHPAVVSIHEHAERGVFMASATTAPGKHKPKPKRRS